MGVASSADIKRLTQLIADVTPGTGDVVGPGAATDNAIARFDSTTGKLLQNSAPLVQDDGRISAVTDPTSAQDVATKAYVDASPGTVGAWVKIQSQTASSSASLDFVTGITSTYDHYWLDIVDLIPGTDNVSLWVRVSHDGGSTWDSAAGSYFYGGHDFGNNVASGLYNDATAGRGSTAVPLGINVDNSGAAGLIGYTGSFFTFRPSNAARHKYEAEGDYLNQINVYVHNIVAGWVTATTAINGLQVLASSGTLLSGTVTLYGLTK